MITYPATSEYWSKDKRESLNKMIDKSMKYSACILLPVGLAVGFFAKDIVTFLFGDEFIHAALPLQILLIGTVINGIICRPIGGSLAGVGRPELELITVGISSAVNIMLNVLLIPILGIIGAAISTSISLSTVSALYLLFVIKDLHVEFDFKWFFKAFGIITILIIVFINFSKINKYIGIILLCVCIILFLKFLIVKEDRQLIKALFHEFTSRFNR